MHAPVVADLDGSLVAEAESDAEGLRRGEKLESAFEVSWAEKSYAERLRTVPGSATMPISVPAAASSSPVGVALSRSEVAELGSLEAGGDSTRVVSSTNDAPETVAVFSTGCGAGAGSDAELCSRALT